MPKYARISEGLVEEIVDLPEGIDPAQAFHPSLILVPATSDAIVGWVYAGGGFSAPLPPPPPPPEALRAAARAECARRILARASTATQHNLSLHAGVLALIPAASRTAAQKADAAALADAAQWVAEMRARWPEIAEQGLDPADDANWPEPSAAAAALAARF